VQDMRWFSVVTAVSCSQQLQDLPKDLPRLIASVSLKDAGDASATPEAHSLHCCSDQHATTLQCEPRPLSLRLSNALCPTMLHVALGDCVLQDV
jgi:hypothetical protein